MPKATWPVRASAFFDSSEAEALSRRTIESILLAHAEAWGMPKGRHIGGYIALLLQKAALKEAELDFAYPYHQAIGFYLEKSGAYKPAEVAPFRRLAREFDFYLTYEMGDPAYDGDWRVYFPTDFARQRGTHHAR